MRPNSGSGVVPAERSIDESVHVADLVAAVVALPLQLDGPDGSTLTGELGDGIGQPDLAATPGRLLRQDVEDVGLQHVPVDRSEIGRASCRERVSIDV